MLLDISSLSVLSVSVVTCRNEENGSVEWHPSTNSALTAATRNVLEGKQEDGGSRDIDVYIYYNYNYTYICILYMIV